jgi:F420-non-reducing hydrogenase large subunit
MTKNITINPITRLEGHGKIEIFLDSKGNVEDAFWQVLELRGFEKFCIGRPVEEMPRITSNICGVCPTPHNIASTKALDDVYSVEPTPTAKLIRQIQYNSFMLEDHYLHFFFLAAPDFIVGPDAKLADRNIFGVIRELGLEIGKKAIEVRRRCRDIIRLVGSKAAHPEGGLPGGVSRQISENERKWISQSANDAVKFAQLTLKLFTDAILTNEEYKDLISHDAYKLDTYYMGMVDDKNRVNFYEGKLRVIDYRGKEYNMFAPENYTDYIGEWVEPWTYIKLTHLKKIGWNGLIEGDRTSLYKVGPLARLNVSNGMATPIAQKEYEKMFEMLGGKPCNHTMAFHWARLIEALQAAEDLQRMANDPILTSKDIRNMNLKLKKVGIGCVEAARGTLIHHYETDENGLITKVNLIVATQHNAAPICLSIKKAAMSFIRNGKVNNGLLDKIEMAFRAYDPCLSCATHTLGNPMNLTVNIRDYNHNIVKTLSRMTEGWGQDI